MQEQRSFAIQSLIISLIFNTVLLGVIYFLAPTIFQDSTQMVTILSAGGVITLGLWLLNLFVGRRLIGEAATEAHAAATIEAKAEIEKAAQAAAEVAKAQKPVEPPKPPPVAPPEASAIQILSILQRKGRLIDFLQEDLTAYEDAQIGAAVRTIHEGCKEALAESLTIEPIYSETEGSRVTVESGFDANTLRLTGNVTGAPPFTGALQHRGWRVTDVNLPKQVADKGKDKVLAPAEVEIGG